MQSSCTEKLPEWACPQNLCPQAYNRKRHNTKGKGDKEGRGKQTQEPNC